jgi:hypothetical protein
MFRVERVATTGLVALVSMPLLTELVSRENGYCYRHGAPNGAVRTSQRVVFRSFSADRTDLPPSVSGFGSSIGFSSLSDLGASCAELAAVLTNTVKAGSVLTNVLRFIEFSYG